MRSGSVSGGGLDMDVEVRRREFPVVASFSVAPGDRLALFGPSGAGKTTLLEAAAGFAELERGEIRLSGRLLSAGPPRRHREPLAKRRVGLLRQQPGLFPHLSAAANIGYALPAGGSDARVRELADLLGIGDLLPARPARLSGGQAQRVALARMLAASSDALLFDEPFNGLDPPLRRRLVAFSVGEAERRAVPAVLVTHDLAEAQSFARTLVVLDRGRVLAHGDAWQVVDRPPSRRAAELVGYDAFVPVNDAVVGLHPSRITVSNDPALAGPRDAGARDVGPRDVVVTGVVSAIAAAGPVWEIEVRLNDGQGANDEQRLSVRLAPGQDAPAPGSSVSLVVSDPPRFDRTTGGAP